MSFSISRRFLPQRLLLVRTSFLQKPGLAFADVLSEERIQQAFDEENVAFAQQDDEVYTPAVTLWAFLSQVLFKDEQRSCAAAVGRVVVLLVALGKELSDNTGAYCRARAKLPEAVLRRLAYDVADGSERAIPDDWRWKGRSVKLVDGTTMSMPDTQANQAEYPQHTAQQEGIGFPIARMVVLVSLATAMVSGMALGPYSGKETGETALLRELFGRLVVGDIVLADRYYCSYFLIVLLQELGVDVVTRQHQLRTTNFHQGERLGKRDHLVNWPRPAKPDWMDQATYDRMPESLRVRELEVRVEQPGFRTEALIVVTTLTDAETYSAEDLAQLYHQRWLVELDIRAIKVSLGIDLLRCKCPEMVRREIWTALLAYNLIRQTMLESAKSAGKSPRQLSFTAALQKIAASWVTLPLLEVSTAAAVIDAHISDLESHQVGHRPNRVEPRAIKRRPTPHKLLTKPRDKARAELLTGKV